MKNRTITLTVPASRDDVFSFLSKIENLPQWAGGLWQDLSRHGAHWKVRTRFGDLFFAALADAAMGVIDVFTGDSLDEMNLTPIRVVSLSHGCAITVTVFHAPDSP